ncbi:MAG: Ig-like domain-containing protein [Prevotella pallens]|uniref:Ig-like domain-containing protein n=1 Tax=Prevotella pallens TaxID=60133 RepID=UPI001CB437D8|nr:Ig-like domain-containing protein [Prevotella pallens]MBF1480995.1 Ig-like domain-containing protein [Prevotella pallens]
MNKQGIKKTSWKVGSIILFNLLLLTIFSCARMGSPDGGWYDETPPKILGTSPANGSDDVNSKKVTILFNEFVKLDNPTEKVVVSPPQLEAPEVKVSGKRITVALQDTLKPNTTYTIDFSDAITDNNEGNPLGNYTYSFSTGNRIDTMEVAGYVLEAQNLEPIKGILVGLYNNLNDTVFQHEPMMRIARTDGNGHFVIKGVAKGDYRIYALQDMDGNYKFNQPGEKIAFTPEIIMPSFKPDVRQDTIWRDSLHISDIKQVPYTHFLPDDVVLSAFTQIQTNRYFLKAERKEPNHFTLFYSYGNAELPEIKGLNFNEKNAFVVEPSLNQDTITYWLRDTMLVNQDTLHMQVSYLANDSLGKLVKQTDTLEVLSKVPYEKRLKQQKDEYDKWKKQQEKSKKKGEPYLTEYPATPLEVRIKNGTQIAPDENPTFILPSPVAICDTSKIHLYEKVDTLWQRAKYQFGSIPGIPRQYKIVGAWNPGHEYSLELDSATFIDIYGKASRKIKQSIKVSSLDEFSTLIVSLQRMEGKNCLLQLLNESDKPIKEVVAKNNEATFYYVKPGTFYLRLIVDENDNGVWDTGLYNTRQPEAVYYYTKEIECKAKRDVRITWNPRQTPLYLQKPAKITKQKADEKQKIKRRNYERAKKLGLEYNPKTGVAEKEKKSKKAHRK